ncbi:molybdopterin-dependent oxidoreductase [Puniceibacterium confluentis]|uniref:molybdopterin-dependent oxidoreductase n=1 Tax=Puniceibacterium confluentis TaxID=1958944 RepID=UPI0011B40083|nr:molybdopterin-dependent oxidoreductase [Puniceibacterium confluentis]
MFKMLSALICGATFATAALAQDTVLEVSVGDTRHEYSLEQLKALPVTSFETTTIWTTGSQTFEGVSLLALMNAIEVAEGTIQATAINDYSVTIPMSDATADGPIIAYLTNGETMSRRDKGPLWIVYPYDSDIKYQNEIIYSRSIWQLDRISIE